MENNSEVERLELLRKEFIEELDTLVAIIQSDEYDGDPFDIDPFSMGFDENIEDLASWEQGAIQEEVYGFLGINSNNPHIIESYMTNVNDTDEELAVLLLSSDKEGVFLHEINFPDGTRRWLLGTQEHI